MKILLLTLFICFQVLAQTRGTDPLAPSTMSPTPYPNSGSTKRLSLKQTAGAAAAHRGTLVPRKKEKSMKIKDNYSIGPYEDGNYQLEPIEAQESQE